MNLRSFFDRTPGFSSLPGIRDRTTLLLLLLALLAWTAGFSLWRDGGDLRNRRTLAEGRFTDLLAVLREYRSLAGLPSKGGEGTPAVLPADQDLLTAVSTVVSSLGLRSSMVSLSTASGRGGEEGVSITLEGITTENLATFLQEIERRGLTASSADIRAVRGTPSSGSPPLRTLSVSLLLGRA